MDPIALHTKEAAELLKLSPVTVKRLARTGQLPARKPGGMYLFSAAALKRWLEDGRLTEVTSTGPNIPKPLKRVVNAAPSVIRRTRRRSRMAVDSETATPDQA